jgi:protein-L-isoaspartate(D-aspartate) O-methyltransferase
MAANHQGIGLTSQRARNRLAEQLRTMGVTDERVLELVRSIPRHMFVDEALASRAYENNALPIGYGQTISQPYIVAAMTETLINTGPVTNVLEIGAGCGYQSAFLANFADRVFSMERILPLANKLRSRLYELKINNVRVRHADGQEGWEKHAPFDAVLVAAAAIRVPEKLVEQLAIGGRLVIPVGPTGRQELILVTKTLNSVEQQVLEHVSFVPLLEGTT